MGVPPSDPVAVPPSVDTPKRRPRWSTLVLAALATVSLVLGAISAAAVSPSPPLQSAVVATYDLNSSDADFGFPDCAVVTVAWLDLSHHQVGFGVFSGAAVSPSNCHGPPDSANHSCPPGGCGPGQASTGPGPTEYENATHGGFQFTATQPEYRFIADNPNSSAATNDPVEFTVSYAVPIVPPAWAPPALIGFLVVGGASVVVAVVLVVRRLTRHP